MIFKKKKIVERPVRTEKTDWPDGTFVQTEEDVFFIKAGKRYRLYSPRVVGSWNASIIKASKSTLAHIRSGGTLGFRDATLIKDVSDGRIYLIAGSKRRHIMNPDVLTDLGYTELLVSHDEALLHQEGEPLNELGTTKITN